LRGAFPTNANFDQGAEAIEVTANQTIYFYNIALTDTQVGNKEEARK